MSTIDERIVKVRFDNEGFKRGVDSTLNSLTSLKNGINSSSVNVANLGKTSKSISFDNLSNGIEGIARKFSAMGIVGITVLQNLTNTAMYTAKKITSAFTIDPVKSGFQEYETQINAVQTILANTSSKGTTLKDINKALDELNYYADKTIYNFTEMTRNIGTFTAAGIDLKTSVNAIQGIANLAAVSGSTSQQASTAMYQLSQALAAGTIRLMDWNSVVNAGMGGEVFQNALKETSRQLKTGADAAIKAKGSFRESLSTGWLTAEVLTETLKKFTTSGANEYVAKYTGLSEKAVEATLESAKAKYGEEKAIEHAAKALAKKSGKNEKEIKDALEMARTAEDAATKVKTFTQLMDTLKEAAQSGWTQTWEILIGDFNEAKGLFTGISDYISNIINDSANVRNDILQGWKDLGGRDKLLKTITKAFNNLLDVLRPVYKAFKNIFPNPTSKKLYSLTKGLDSLVDKFKVSKKTTENIQKTFEGLFSILHVGLDVVLSLVKGAGKLALCFVPLGGSIASITGLFGSMFKEIGKGLSSVNVIDKIFNGLSSLIDSLIGKFETGEKIVVNGVKKLGKIFKTLYNTISQSADTSSFDFNAIAGLLNSGMLASVLLGVRKFINDLNKGVELGTGVLDNIKTILSSSLDCIKAWQNNINAQVLLKIAIAVGILAAALTAFSMINPKNLMAGLASMTVLFGELYGFMYLLVNNIDSKKFRKIERVGALLIKISVAIDILSLALKRISQIDLKGLVKGLGGMQLMLMMLASTVTKMSSGTPEMMKGSFGLILMASSIVILTKAVERLGKLSLKDLEKGLIGVGATLTAIVLFMKATDDINSMGIRSGTGLLLLSASVLVLSKSVEAISKMGTKGIISGIAAIGALLSEMVIFKKLTGSSKGLISTATGMTIMSGSLLLMSQSLKLLGDMNLKEIGNALVAIGGGLTILAISLNAMKGCLPGAVAIGIASGALAVLTPQLLMLGAMKWSGIKTGMVALAGAFTILGIAGLALQPLIPAIVGLSAAFALVGAGFLVAGAGLTAIGTGLSAIAIGITSLVAVGVSGLSTIASVIKSLVGSIATTIPLIMREIGKGIVLLAKTVASRIPTLAASVSNIILGMLNEFNKSMSKFIKIGFDIVLSVLKGISQNILKVVSVAIDIIVNFVNAISNNLDKIVQAGFDLIISFINAMADAIDNNTQRLVDAGWHLFSSIVKGCIKGALSLLGNIFNAGEKLVLNFIKGIKNAASSAVNIGKRIVGWIKKGIKNAISSIGTLGKNIVDGLTGGIKNFITNVKDAGAKLGNAAKEGAEKALDINSPSKVFAQIGVYAGEGLVKGMLSKTSDTKKAGEALAKSAISGTSAFLKKYNEAYNSMPYGKKAMTQYISDYTTNTKKVSKNVTTAKKAITEYAKKIYKESDAYKEDTANIKKHKKTLSDLEKQRDKFAKQLKNKNLSTEKRKQIQANLDENKKSIKDVKKVIKQDSKDVADHIKQTYENLRNTIKQSVEDFADPLKASFDAQISLFEKFSSESDLTLSDYMSNMQSQIEGVTEWNNSLKQLLNNNFDEKLVDKIRDLGPSSLAMVKQFLTASSAEIEQINKMFTQSTQLSVSTYLENVEKSLTTAEEWGKNMKTLAQNGFKQEIVEAVRDSGVDGYEFLNMLLSMTPAEVARFNEDYSKFLKLPAEVADKALAASAYAGTDAAKAFTNSLRKLINDGETDATSKQIGSKVVTSMSEGIESKKSVIVTVSKDVSKSAYSGLKTYMSKPKGKTLGDNMCTGIANGLYAGKSGVISAAVSVAISAYEAAKAALDVNSPSKKFAELGKYSCIGFANGLLSYSSDVGTAAERIGGTAIEGVKNSISNISEAITNGIDCDPVIRPVIDTSDIEKGANRISGILNASRSVKLATATSNEMASNKKSIENDAVSTKTGVSNISFTQNNYSPKALSRLDIYRQTRNQFSAMKGVLDKV